LAYLTLEALNLAEVRSGTAAIQDTRSDVGAETPDARIPQAKTLAELTQEGCAAPHVDAVVYDLRVPFEETPALLQDGEFRCPSLHHLAAW
jgi:hypothetical protein